MAYLLDTNILARLVNTADMQQVAAVEAIRRLHREGEVMHLTPQTLIEFRSVGTRALANNGLGLSEKRGPRGRLNSLACSRLG